MFTPYETLKEYYSPSSCSRCGNSSNQIIQYKGKQLCSECNSLFHQYMLECSSKWWKEATHYFNEVVRKEGN